MADPSKYERDYSFTDYQSNNPRAPLPGNQVDNELENIEQSLNGAIDAIKDVRRADGKLKNGSVTVEALSPEAVEMIAGSVAGYAGTAATSAGQAMAYRNEASTFRDLASTARLGAQAARDDAAGYAAALDAAVETIEGLGFFYDWGYVFDAAGVTTDYGVVA